MAVLLWLAAASLAQAFYNPNVGKWLNRDPSGEGGGENLYAAVYNALIDDIDPFGLAACKSNYRWIVHPPLRDRDLQSPQTITVHTTVTIGTSSSSISRSATYSGLWGLTITQPSTVGGHCCCVAENTWKPYYELIVHSQIYLLDSHSSAWGVSRINSGDPNVDDYWHYSPQWHRRNLVMNHEERHQADGRKNYGTWKTALQATENTPHSTESACLQAVDDNLHRTWLDFQHNEEADVIALHGGRRSP